MAQCVYHPDKRGTATCPNCKKSVCDRCRLNGTSQGCMTCHSAQAKGGADGAKAKRNQCANHAGVVTDLTCKGCRKPHCPACLNTASMCFRCALSDPAKSAPGPRAKTGPIKGGKTGKLKGPPPRKGPPKWLIPAGVAGLAIVGAAAFFLMKPAPEEPPAGYLGPTGVQFVTPQDGQSLKGGVDIALKVVAPTEVEQVVLNIDGKYWDKFSKAPFKSHWPTSLIPNGAHTLEAKVTYRGGAKTAVAKLSVKTKNRKR